VEAAQRWLPEVRAQGADIVVAVAHAGLNPAPYTLELENAGWHLAGVAGIDALLLGHSHNVFPAPEDASSRFASMPEVDNVKGFVRGVPAVMGGFYAQDLGLIKLALLHKNGHWQVDREHTHSEVRAVRGNDGKAVAADPAIAPLVKAEHEATLAWLNTPLGKSEYRLSTIFAEQGDVSALGVVNAAQSDYAAKWIKQNRADLATVPVLSAAAAFKTGFAGPDDYTDVAPGAVTLRSATDLYLYPNTIAAVLIDGTTLKAWLERSAQRFNQIDPAATAPQVLISKKIPGYNFDVIQGDLAYTIDITKPMGERIVELRHRGKPVQGTQRFVVATNNYRSTDTAIPGLNKAEVLFSGDVANRDVVIAYLKTHSPLSRRSPYAKRPWHFVRTKLAGPVTFVAPAGKIAQAKTLGLPVGGGKALADKPALATYTLVLGK
jgi:2',3'-cyclic-nucleotide 2'-phosphodiesterase/3'-nucleotidase